MTDERIFELDDVGTADFPETISLRSVAVGGRVTRITQEMINEVLSDYSEEIANPNSEHSRFFRALSSGSTAAELEVFNRVYSELYYGDYMVEDFLLYTRKFGAAFSIAQIDAFSRNTRAAKIAGMKEKVFNGNFYNYGNLFSFVSQFIFSDQSNPIFINRAEEAAVRDEDSLLLRPDISYFGERSFQRQSEASELYWSVVSSFMLSEIVSLSGTAYTGVVDLGDNFIRQVSPDPVSVSNLSLIVKVGGSGDLGANIRVADFIPRTTVPVVGTVIPAAIRVSSPSIKSGNISFRIFPSEYLITNYCKKVVFSVVDASDGASTVNYPAFLSDPVNRQSYSASRESNLRINELASEFSLRLSQDQVVEQIGSMISDLVDFYDENVPANERDYENSFELPDIRAFVSDVLDRFQSDPVEDYDLAKFMRLRFYKYIMARYVGITSHASFAKEDALAADFGKARSILIGIRNALIATGKFLPQ
jgi:hypothetical protein